MTDYLIRLALRRTKEEHTAIGMLAGTAGIVCNVLLACMKLAVGILTGSVAIAGDGVNNLTDCASSVVTLLGFRMARRPADREHPYGHGRYEYLSGVVVAALVLTAGAELARSSAEKLLHPSQVSLTPAALGVLAFSILVKLWLRHFQRQLNRRSPSSALEAAAQDSRNDVLTTGAILLCFLAERYLPISLDGYAGLAVAAFILYSGIGLCRQTISPLLGMQADLETVKALEALVLAHRRVLGIHDLQIHDYGPDRRFATIHAEMDAAEPPLQAHDQLDHIEQEALHRLGIHLVIHWDPVVRKDWEDYRAQAARCLAEITPEAGLHDLRVVRYRDQETLTFDVTVPYDLLLSDEAITEQLQQSLTAHGCTIPVQIRIDRQ